MLHLNLRREMLFSDFFGSGLLCVTKISSMAGAWKSKNRFPISSDK